MWALIYEKDIIAGMTQLNGKNILIFSLLSFIFQLWKIFLKSVDLMDTLRLKELKKDG